MSSPFCVFQFVLAETFKISVPQHTLFIPRIRQFIYGLFNNAVSNLVYVSSHGGINEW